MISILDNWYQNTHNERLECLIIIKIGYAVLNKCY